MARTEIWVEDDAAPTGRWVWIGGYEGAGVNAPVLALATGTSSTVGTATAAIPGLVFATATGTSSTTGTAVAAPVSSGQYLALTGVDNSIASIPDETAFDFTGSHTIRIRMRKADWTPATNQVLISKWGTVDGNLSWWWRLQTTAAIYFQWTTNGSAYAAVSSAAPASPPEADEIIWIQLALNSSNRQITLSTHADQVSEPTTGWTQVAASVAGATTGNIYNSSAAIVIGSLSSPYQPLEADIFQLTIRNAADALVFQLDPDNWTSGSTWVSSTGQTVTLGAAATIETA